MTATVDVHRLAVAEFARARRWYARRSVAVAGRFDAAVRAALARITAAPAAGTAGNLPYRWAQAGRFPFLLHYGPIAPDVWRVYAIAHTSRRPGYWLRRTRRP